MVSFAEDTVKELLLKDQKSWQRYMENHIMTIAGKNGIKRENLQWAAAVHGEKSHPHIHVVFWDKSVRVKNPFTPQQIPNTIRKQMIKDTFAEKILVFAKEKDLAVQEMLWKDRFVIKVEKSKTVELVERAVELTDAESQYRIPWIVFDRDQVKDFDEIIRTAEKNSINTGWSNPCFEIWMYSYFGEIPAIRESYTCCNRFAEKFEKVTGQKYSKKDRDIYIKLVQYGDEEKAFRIAEQCYKKCKEYGKEIHQRCGLRVWCSGWWKRYRKKLYEYR